MRLMDCREAKACIEEYSILLANTCRLLQSKVPQGPFLKVIEEINDGLVVSLKALMEQALILSTIILREFNARAEGLYEFPQEWTEVKAALDELDLAIKRTEQEVDEYVAKDAVRKERGGLSEIAFALRQYRREYEQKQRDERERRSKEPT